MALMTNYMSLPHCRPTVSLQALWFLKEVGEQKNSRATPVCCGYCLNSLVSDCLSLPATLLVAVNEIKKSARQNGLSFYEYG